MKTRIISAIVGVVFVILLLIFGEMWPFLFAIVFGIANAIVCMEFLSARKLQKNLPILITTLVFAVSMPMVAITSVWYLPLYIYTLLMFVYLIILRQNLNLKDVTFCFFGVFAISSALSMFSRLVVNSGGWHSFFFVIAVVGSWCADSAAYFAGSFLGKRKLCPSISPNKTVEGALGGVLGAVAGVLLAGLIFRFIVFSSITVNFWALFVIGVFTSVVSIIGDLVFSVIKRECGIKDYGSIMPGHGGLLDRIDSVIFCVPFIYFLSQTWGLIALKV